MLEGSHLNSRIEYVQMSVGIPKSPVKGKGGAGKPHRKIAQKQAKRI
jgi:hypothetical protein